MTTQAPCGACVGTCTRHEVFETATHRYRVRALGASSAKYGPCEVCGEHCAEVSYQVPMTRNGAQKRGTFGHRACLDTLRG